MSRGQDRPAPAAPGPAGYRPTFNLFRHKLIPDLLCAVPVDCPVPGFLDARTWGFAGAVSEAVLTLAEPAWHAAISGAKLARCCLFRSDGSQHHAAETGSTGTSSKKAVLSSCLNTTEAESEPIDCLA
jgi:hypothetical protein